MKKIVFVFILSLMLPLGALAQTLTATLSGANEVGGGDPDGAGLAILNIDGNQIHYTVLVSGIDAPTAGHIHQAVAGTNGDVVVNLSPSFTAGTATGSVSADSAIVGAILSNPAGFYVNIHNAPFPNGAVRGQLSAGSASGGQFTSYLPVVGKAQGANNTNFVTDVRIINPGTATATVSVSFWESSLSGHGAPTATAQLQVGAGEQAILDDITGSLINAPGKLGAMRFTSDVPVVVTARVNNDLRGQGLGATGFSVRGVGLADASAAGTIPFLSHASGDQISAGIGFRTNIGWFNPGPDAISVTVTAHASASGNALAVSTITVPGFSHLQRGVLDVLGSLGNATSAERENFYLTYQASAPLFFYGSVVDNKTGDSVYID